MDDAARVRERWAFSASVSDVVAQMKQHNKHEEDRPMKESRTQDWHRPDERICATCRWLADCEEDTNAMCCGAVVDQDGRGLIVEDTERPCPLSLWEPEWAEWAPSAPDAPDRGE